MHDYPFEHDHQLDAHAFDHCCLDCAAALTELRRVLGEFHAQIAHHDPSSLAALAPDELFRLFLVLDDIAHLDGGARLARGVEKDAAIHAMLPDIRAYYETFFALHERHFAEAILASSDPWKTVDSFALISRYEGLIANERTLFGARDPEPPLVFVGCGAAPVSLWLHARAGAGRAIGIDLDPAALDLAHRCLDRLGLRGRIELVEGNEERLADLDAGTVLVAALAEPKARIFETLHRLLESRPDTPVLYRTYTGLCTLLHAPVEPTDVVGFESIGEVAATGRINNTSVRVRRVDR